jgi:cytochrome P450
MMRLVLGNGLLTSEGDFWKRQRRIANPSFHRQRIAAFAETMARAAADMVESWRGRAELDVSQEMMHVTLRIVSETMLSRPVTREADDVGAALSEVLEHLIYRIQTPWSMPEAVPTPGNLRFRRARARLDAVVGAVIEERRRAGDERGDLLGMLMSARDDEGRGMDDRQLRDEVMTIFLAGHETTSVALSWTLYLLALHPAWDARLRAEVAEMGSRAPLLSRVLQESMRLFPPAWMLSREAIADDLLCGHTVRAGDFVFVSPYLTHRRADLWPDPEAFDPDRFTEARSAGRHHFAYFPFGAGQRKCIGDQFALMEAQIVLATLLHRVRFTLDHNHAVVPDPLVTLRPKNGIRMRVDLQ